MQAFGEDVAAVVHKIGGENVILVGHSMGGPVAIEAAELLGDNVIGIVGVDAFYTPLKYLETTAQVDELTKPFKEDFKGAMEQFVRHMFTPEADPDIITSIVNQMSNANQDMAIRATYEINRWHTRNVPTSLDKFSKKLRNINAAPTGKETALHKSVLLIPGVGHFVAQVKPDEFNEALNRLISEFQAH
jgi:pimeloyl-ACP methyl ester carboxylesterase